MSNINSEKVDLLHVVYLKHKEWFYLGYLARDGGDTLKLKEPIRFYPMPTQQGIQIGAYEDPIFTDSGITISRGDVLATKVLELGENAPIQNMYNEVSQGRRAKKIGLVTPGKTLS